MERNAGPVMTLCPNCKSIQKADSVCSICKYPIPPKDSRPEEPGGDKQEGKLAAAVKTLAQYGYPPRLQESDDEITEPDLPVGAPKRPRLPTRTRIEVNSTLSKYGLDGNGRFASPSAALDKAQEVLAKHGIELDTTPDSWALTKYDQFRLTLDVAWTNEADSFSPVSIENSMLVFTWYKFQEEVYEALAYLS